MASRNYVIAHDLGTTGNKATLYDREGTLVGSAFYGYETEYARPGWAEQNPEDWWQAVCASTRELLAKTGVPKHEIACVTFSGQMMGCVPLDRNARPLAKGIIWADTRSVAQEQWLRERIDPEDVYRITGHRLSASYSLAKILWLRQNRPDIYRDAYRFVHVKDAITARLTGVFVTEPSDGSSMNLYDINRWQWSERLIEAAEIDAEKLPEVRRSIDIAGEIRPEVADEVGLLAGTPVVLGGGDGPCAAIGAGVVREGQAYAYIGSSSWIGIATPRPVFDPTLRTFTFAHLIPEMLTPTGTMQAAGASYQWARNQLAPLEVMAAYEQKADVYELMNAAAEQSPIGARGLIYLPYLLGERSPRWNPLARGAFIGLTMRHTQADMLRAVLEGVTLNLRVIMDCFTAQGVSIEKIRVIGGGAKGRFWNQMMADVFGVPVHRPAILGEAPSMGAAVAGGIGVGLYTDWEMAERMNPDSEIIEPRPEAVARYAELLPVFEAAYQQLTPVYDMLAAFDRDGVTEPVN